MILCSVKACLYIHDGGRRLRHLYARFRAETPPYLGNDAQEAELERRVQSLDEDRRDGVKWIFLKADVEKGTGSVFGYIYSGH